MTLVEANGAGKVKLYNGVSKAATFRTNDAAAIIEVAGGGTLEGNVDATVNGGNLVFLGAGEVTGTIGAGNALTLVEARGAGIVQLNNTVEADTLSVKNGATIDAKNSTVAAIAAINIGEALGAGTLIIDANADYALNNAGNITFAHADSLLKLTNTTVANRTVTLKGNLTSGVDEEGKLEINADGTNTLTLAVNAAESIGLNGANRIQELIVSGKQAVTIALNVFAQTINISSTGDVTFTAELNSGIADASSINFKAAGATALEAQCTTLWEKHRRSPGSQGVHTMFCHDLGVGSTTSNASPPSVYPASSPLATNCKQLDCGVAGGRATHTVAYIGMPSGRKLLLPSAVGLSRWVPTNPLGLTGDT